MYHIQHPAATIETRINANRMNAIAHPCWMERDFAERLARSLIFRVHIRIALNNSPIPHADASSAMSAGHESCGVLAKIAALAIKRRAPPAPLQIRARW